MNLACSSVPANWDMVNQNNAVTRFQAVEQRSSSTDRSSRIRLQPRLNLVPVSTLPDRPNTGIYFWPVIQRPAIRTMSPSAAHFVLLPESFKGCVGMAEDCLSH